jgi:integrase
MAIYKRITPSGRTVWYFIFDAPDSTRANRHQIKESGFATKNEAQDAEAARRIEEKQKYELVKAGGPVNAPLPKTLAMLLDEFFRQHVEEKLAPKTIERYREQAAYLDPTLLGMLLAEITPLHLNREWGRLLKGGGHHRRTKVPRPMSAKTVRDIAGVVSSAFTRAVKWGLVTRNPVSDSEPPVPKKGKAMALTVAQQDMLLEAASGPWCMRTLLEVAAAMGCRRGEVLALRWSDIVDGRAMVSRSLTQTRHGLEFKDTKTEEPRAVSLPDSAIAALYAHRKRQDEFRRHFGPDYRADPGFDIRESRRHAAEAGFDLSFGVGTI